MRLTLQNIWVATFLLVIILCSGCEDVIDVNIENTAPQLVIEGNVTQLENEAYFRISRSTGYDAANRFDPVSGAVIYVRNTRDTYGIVLEEDSTNPGSYRGLFDSFYYLVPGDVFEAQVTVDGKTFTARSTTPQYIPIDSLLFEYQSGGGLGLYEDKGFRPHVYFTDSLGVPDYARIRLTRNDTLLTTFNLYDGKYSDGNRINYEYFFDVYQPGDHGTVELISMDRGMYDYFLTLSEVAAIEEGQDPFDITPANPNTNWDNGALGYFGVFEIDTRIFFLNF